MADRHTQHDMTPRVHLDFGHAGAVELWTRLLLGGAPQPFQLRCIGVVNGQRIDISTDYATQQDIFHGVLRFVPWLEEQCSVAANVDAASAAWIVAGKPNPNPC